MESGLEYLYRKLEEAEQEAEKTAQRYTSLDMLYAVWDSMRKE